MTLDAESGKAMKTRQNEYPTIYRGMALIADPIDAKMILGTAIALSGVLIIALRSGKGSALPQAEEHS